MVTKLWSQPGGVPKAEAAVLCCVRPAPACRLCPWLSTREWLVIALPMESRRLAGLGGEWLFTAIRAVDPFVEVKVDCSCNPWSCANILGWIEESEDNSWAVSGSKDSPLWLDSALVTTDSPAELPSEGGEANVTVTVSVRTFPLSVVHCSWKEKDLSSQKGCKFIYYRNIGSIQDS